MLLLNTISHIFRLLVQFPFVGVVALWDWGRSDGCLFVWL